MYSSTASFDRLKLQLQNVNFQLAVLGQKWDSLCKSKTRNKKIIEAFQDNMDKEARAAGSIFCEPLNGKFIGFPVTINEFEEIRDFQTTIIKKKRLKEMSITVNAKSFASTGVKPYISQSVGGPAELLDIENSKFIKPSKEVLHFISVFNVILNGLRLSAAIPLLRWTFTLKPFGHLQRPTNQVRKITKQAGAELKLSQFFSSILNCFLEYVLAGQLSDSACGTLKRCIKNNLKSGKGRTFINCAFFHCVHSNHFKQNSFAFFAFYTLLLYLNLY